jgi:hypothetical protein
MLPGKMFSNMNYSKEQVRNALKSSWSQETCHIPLKEKWNKENPVIGQYAVSTLIIQDYFGGKIIHDKKNKHYWNEFEDGTIMDATRHQFPINTSFQKDEYIEREKLFNPKARTKERYEILKQRVKKYLKSLK